MRIRSGVVTKKLGMSYYLDESSEMVGATFLKIEDCIVVDVKSSGNNVHKVVVGYNINKKRSKKPLVGFFQKKNIEYRRFLKEFKIVNSQIPVVGEELKCNRFMKGDFVDVRSKTVGKGFAGGMKRHNFKGLEATHGVSISHRAHGSTGGCQDPGRVFKNKKMAGHLGDKFVTVQNLKILDKREKDNIIVLKGSVPGSKGSYVYLQDAIKKIFH